MHPSPAVTYTIYNIIPRSHGKKGAAWFRYGTLQDRNDALQMAQELFASREFTRVEVHETRRTLDQPKSRVLKVFTQHSLSGPMRLGLVATLCFVTILSTVFIF